MKRPSAGLATTSTVIAVVIIALLLTLVGRSVRADVIGTITGPIIVSPVCEVIVGVLTLGMASSLCPQEHSVSPAPPEPIRCTPARFTGPPTFFTNPIVTVKYQFHGSCFRGDLPAPPLTYRLEGSWTPGETNPNKPNASESIEITGYEPYMPDRAPGGRLFMYWTAHCNREPWLSPEEAACQRVGSYIPDDLQNVVPPHPDLWRMLFPRTRYSIPANDRQQWYAHYLRLTGPVAATKATPVPKQPSPIQQTAPLPSSSVTQPSVVPHTTPLPPPSVMQAPSPMRRSPSMIRPRGVGEKGGTDTNQTLGQAAEKQQP